jgi:hypothetical protein
MSLYTILFYNYKTGLKAILASSKERAMKNSALIVAGIIFTIVAVLHLLRIIYKSVLIIAGVPVPMTLSSISLVVAVILALWMFSAAKKP